VIVNRSPSRVIVKSQYTSNVATIEMAMATAMNAAPMRTIRPIPALPKRLNNRKAVSSETASSP
jgi:hypothetical protein